MSEKANHWCIICGNGYHACDSCNEVKTFKPWRSLTDTVEHYKIFCVLKEYNEKFLTKEEAYNALMNLDLSGRESFKDGAKKTINEIMSHGSLQANKKPEKMKQKKMKDEEVIVSSDENKIEI